MAFWSGTGGSVNGVNLSKYMLRSNSRLAETTNSGLAASTYQAVIQDNSWSLEMPWDSSLPPESAIGDQGDVVTLVLNLGLSGDAYTLTDTTVENIEIVDDSVSDVIRAVVTGKGGVLT